MQENLTASECSSLQSKLLQGQTAGLKATYCVYIEIDEAICTPVKQVPALYVGIKMKDWLICVQENQFLNRLGTPEERRRKDTNLIETKLRSLAGLVMLNQERNYAQDLSVFLKPRCFNSAVDAAKQLTTDKVQE